MRNVKGLSKTKEAKLHWEAHKRRIRWRHVIAFLDVEVYDCKYVTISQIKIWTSSPRNFFFQDLKRVEWFKKCGHKHKFGKKKKNSKPFLKKSEEKEHALADNKIFYKWKQERPGVETDRSMTAEKYMTWWRWFL